MIGLLLALVVCSLLVLAAHFFRAGNLAMVAAVLARMALRGVRRRWAARLVQVALLAGAAEWLRTLLQLAAWRSQTEQPALRLLLILGSVALLTALSALVFRAARLRKWYDPGQTPVSTR